MEHVDDVATHNANGTIVLEQVKSATRQNPMSDWAEDFWKAIANWIDVLTSDLTLVGKTHFRFYVSPPKTGPFAQQLSDATTAKDVDAVLQKIAMKVAKKTPAPVCMPYLQLVLAAGKHLQHGVFLNLKILPSHADPVEPLRSLLSAVVSPESLDLMCESAIGMAKQRADRLIQQKHPAVLDGDEFKRDVRAFVQRNLLPNYLSSLSVAPANHALNQILSNRPTFVRQLEYVGIEEHGRLRAISDYLRSSADKSDWAERGLVMGDSLREFDEHLIGQHDHIASDVNDQFPSYTAEQRGRMSYRKCAQLQTPLESRVVPSHFVHGCFNALADEQRIGWHPDFSRLLEDQS